MYQDLKASVVGLGKLGSPLVAALACQGIEVVGYDVNKSLVDQINRHEAPTSETQLAEYLKNHSNKISATHDIQELLLKTQVTFVIVPTPSDESGKFSNDYLKAAFLSLGKALKKKSEWHLFVVTSTVMPGSMQNEIIPEIEKSSGKKLNQDFGVCYSPLFIALGSVIKNILNPDFCLIGESDVRSGKMLESIYSKLVSNRANSFRMNFVNAELAKISVNAYVTMKISFANQLAEMCEKLPGADVDVVTHAVGSDSRVGKKYLKGALGFGGPCFPRDSDAVAFLGKKLEVPALLAEATDQINLRQVHRVVSHIEKKLKRGSRVMVSGLSYKPDTEVIEKSQGIMIAQMLSELGFQVAVFDPIALNAAKNVLGKNISYVQKLEQGMIESEGLVIALPGKEYVPYFTAAPTDIPHVFDCWGSITDPNMINSKKYIKLGKGDILSS